MSSSISALAANNDIAAPTSLLSDPSSAEFQVAAGNPNLQVDGNTIDTGRYLIIASTASTHGAAGSNADDGEVTIYDKQTNTYLNVWGDPHLTASDGNLAEFQQDGLTINLGDGTQVEFTPTALSNGVAHIDDMTVTKNGQTVGITNFEGQGGTSSPTVSSIIQGNASAYNSSMDNVTDTILTAGSSDIGQLVFDNGTTLNSTTSQLDLDGIGGGVEEYMPGFIGNSVGTDAAGSAAASATNSAIPVSTSAATSSSGATPTPTLTTLIQNLTAAVASTSAPSGEQTVATAALQNIFMSLQNTPAASAGGSSGISQSTLDSIYNNALGGNVYTPPAAPAMTTTQMIDTLNQMINTSGVSPTEMATLDTNLSSVALVFAPPAPVASTPAAATPAAATSAVASSSAPTTAGSSTGTSAAATSTQSASTSSSGGTTTTDPSITPPNSAATAATQPASSSSQASA